MKINLQNFNNIFLRKNEESKRTEKNSFFQNSCAINPFKPLAQDTLSISFKQAYCSEKDFEVKNLKNLHCPVCGLVMLNEEQMGVFILDIGNKCGEDLVQTLEKYEDESVFTNQETHSSPHNGIYRPFMHEIVKIYKNLAMENPGQNLLQLTKIQAKKSIDELIAVQMEVIKEVEEWVDKNYTKRKDLEDWKNKIDEYKKQIKGESNIQFARKKFIYAMAQKVTDSEKKKEINEITAKMPTSENDINSFFVKYASYKSPKEIAKALVYNARPTAEHLTPKSKGGKDSLANYICDCADCNSRKSNEDFYSWIQNQDGLEERLQQYIDEVAQAVDREEFENGAYDMYPETIVETIQEISNGEILLEVPDYTNPKKLARVVAKRKKEIEEMTHETDKLAKRAQEIQDQITALKSWKKYQEVFLTKLGKEEIQNINKMLEELSAKLVTLRPLIYEAKKELDEAQAIKNSATNQIEKEKANQNYEEKERAYNSLKAEEKALLSAQERLKRENIKLKKQQKFFARQYIDLDAKIEQYKERIRNIILTQREIEELEGQIKYAREIQAKYDELESTISKLEAQNSLILTNPDFDKNDDADYSDYLEQAELLETANKMLSAKHLQKSGLNASSTRQVIEIAKEVLEERVGELLSLDSVIYFANLDRIETLSEQKEKQGKKLNEIYQINQEITLRKRKLSALYKGDSLGIIKSQLSALEEEKEKIELIDKMPKMMATLESLNRLVETNRKQLAKLENYAELTNTQYADIVVLIGFDSLSQIEL